MATMNGRTRTLLALAMSTALITPLAFAQQAKTEVKTSGNATSQAATELSRQRLPTEAGQRAVDATVDVTEPRPAARAADAEDARVVPAAKLPVQSGKATEQTEQAQTEQTQQTEQSKQIPPTAQGATHAAAHSSVVQRDVWARLDADADGRISATEADADAGIEGSFSAIDSNSDGFITDAEFRTHAKTTSTP